MKKGIFIVISIVAIVAAAMGGISAADARGQSIAGEAQEAGAFSFSRKGDYTADMDLLGESYTVDVSFLRPVVEFYGGVWHGFQLLNAPTVRFIEEAQSALSPVVSDMLERWLPKGQA